MAEDYDESFLGRARYWCLYFKYSEKNRAILKSRGVLVVFHHGLYVPSRGDGICCAVACVMRLKDNDDLEIVDRKVLGVVRRVE